MKPLMTLFAAAVLATTVATASAQTIGAQAVTKEKTLVTFSAPVRVPGEVLPAGEYMFRLANPMFGDRQTVEIWNRDESEKIATILTVPLDRPDTLNDLVLTFRAPAGQPPALKAWFYPVSDEGHAFVYPREEAREIARAAAENVPAADLPSDWDAPGATITIVQMDPQGVGHPEAAGHAQHPAQAPHTRSGQQADTAANAVAHLDKAETVLGQIARRADRNIDDLQNDLRELRAAYQPSTAAKPADAAAWEDKLQALERDLDRMIAEQRPVGTTGAKEPSLEDVRQHLRDFRQAVKRNDPGGKR